MRGAWSLFALATLASDVSQHGGDVGIPLKSVIGEVQSVEDFARWGESNRLNTRLASLGSKSSLYHELRLPAHCVFPMDIVILQDLTDSFNDNIDEMRNVQLKKMVTGLASSHPNSRFAVVGFQDKPIWKMGDRDDACWILESDFTSDFEAIYDTYSKFSCYGGADAPENQFGAISAAFGTSKLSWASGNSERSKLIVVVTDAGPHHADDGVVPADGTILQQWTGVYSDANAENLCLKTGYPSAQEIYNQIVAAQAYVAFLVFDGDWANGWAANEWKTFNRFIGQPDEFVQQDTEDSSLFWQQLSKIITQIENVECIIETTTTTTTVATTASQVVPPPPAPTTIPATPPATTASQIVPPPPAPTTIPATPPATTASQIVPPPPAPTTIPATPPATTASQIVPPPPAPTTIPAPPPSSTASQVVPPAPTFTTPSTISTVLTQLPPPLTRTTGPLPPPPTGTAECKPTVIVDGNCVPAPENCWCHPEVLIQLAFRPDTLNLVADDKVVAKW